jgi:signal transduction histidine kinase
MRMVRFKFWQLAIIIALSVGFVVALFTVAEFGRARLAEAADDVRHAQQQWIRVVDLQQILLDAESGHRGYLLTGDPRHLAPLANARERIDTLARELAAADLGRDERVAKATRLLQSVADQKVTEMNASIALYRQQGPVAALAIADSASVQEVMGRFRELAGITRDYEQSLVERSLRNWDRELSVVRRLNLATLVVGLVLAGLAITAMLRNMRQRHDAAVDLARQHDLLKAQADAQAAELNELYRHLQHVQEEERARLSRGLHDELGGVLLAARMDVTWMQHNSPHDPEEFQERLERVRRALDQGIDLKRRVVEELRPTLLDTMGLVAALRWQIEESCKRADLRSIENFPEVEPQFSRAGAITLFRVVQEALANVLKHARATEVWVAMEMTDDHVVLTISDDGVGSTTQALGKPGSHGIAGMRHRVHVLGGRLDIAASPGRGTHVRVEVPLASVMQPTGVDAETSGVFAAVPWAERSDSAAAAS